MLPMHVPVMHVHTRAHWTLAADEQPAAVHALKGIDQLAHDNVLPKAEPAM